MVAAFHELINFDAVPPRGASRGNACVGGRKFSSVSEWTDTHTWDGLARALDRPEGAAVVVRRWTDDKHQEFLLLHRNAEGSDYEGDWAWTSPAGCRQPGEAVYPAALRELAEEAGLSGLDPWAVDLSGPWARFAVDVEADTEISLVDPEHDRYEWVGLEQALARVLPEAVGEAQFGEMAHLPRVTIGFRRMVDADLAHVLRWQQASHARHWFRDEPQDLAGARVRYGPRIDGLAPVRVWVVEIKGKASGYLQDYRVRDHHDYALKTQDADAVGFDYLIGEPHLVSRGVGTAMVWAFLRDVLCPSYPDTPRFSASPDHRNQRSLRVLEKCGFTQGVRIDLPAADGEPATSEIVCTLDRAHWFGMPDDAVDVR